MRSGWGCEDLGDGGILLPKRCRYRLACLKTKFLKAKTMELNGLVLCTFFSNAECLSSNICLFASRVSQRVTTDSGAVPTGTR